MRWYQPRFLYNWPPAILKKRQMRFYKHLPSKFANDLVERGKILVGTVEKFRRMNLSDLARGDVAECEYVQYIHHFSSDSHGRIEDYLLPTTLPHFETSGSEPPVGSTISNVALGYKVPDGFVYCMSHSRKKSTGRLFAGADACVEIVHPTEFFETLGSALNEIVSLSSLRPDLDNCVYRERITDLFVKPHRPIHFIKSPNYSAQREIRAFWWPDTTDPFAVLPEPGVLHVPELASHCRLVNLAD